MVFFLSNEVVPCATIFQDPQVIFSTDGVKVCPDPHCRSMVHLSQLGEAGAPKRGLKPLNNSPGNVTGFHNTQYVAKLYGKLSVRWA